MEDVARAARIIVAGRAVRGTAAGAGKAAELAFRRAAWQARKRRRHGQERPLPRPFADLWLMPHRPFLLAAAAWAAVAILWWQWGAALGLAPPVLGTAAMWHAHEMLAGMGSAAAAGYLLTALASWTGRPAPSGRVLKLLVGCWLLQRLAMAAPGVVPPALALLPGAGFFGLLSAVLAIGILRAGAWRRLGLAAVIALLGAGDALLIHAALEGWARPDPALLARAGVMLFALLIAVIGGRMIPAFTDNWLRQTGAAARCRPTPIADRLGPLLIAAAAGLMLAEAGAAAGAALVAAGLVQGWRLALWRGWTIRANPLLLMLHAGFAWLPAGLVLTGLARLLPLRLAEVDMLHALTMGAMGGMILAVAARAAARRAGGALVAGRLLAAAALLLWLAVWLRLAAGPWPGAAAVLNGAAALAWLGGWAAFLAAFLPSAFGPVRRPVFSGTRG